MNVLNVPVGKFEFTDFSSMRDKTDQSRSITIHDNFTDFGEKVFIRIHGGSVYVCQLNLLERIWRYVFGDHPSFRAETLKNDLIALGVTADSFPAANHPDYSGIRGIFERILKEKFSATGPYNP